MSHAILLGLALGAICKINPLLALMIFAVIFAVLIFFTTKNRYLGKDTTVMITSYFAIALAIIFNDLWIQNLDFSAYIFGDILAVGPPETVVLGLISVIAVGYVIYGMKKIMLLNLNADLAQISGIKTKYWELSFLILLAITIAITTHIIGIFLTTAILVLPAAIARIFAKSAKEMMIISALIGVVMACFSFGFANKFNLTIGPMMIASLCVIFFAAKTVKSLQK